MFRYSTVSQGKISSKSEFSTPVRKSPKMPEILAFHGFWCKNCEYFRQVIENGNNFHAKITLARTVHFDQDETFLGHF